MDRALRAEYLQALGIDVWVPRAAAPPPPAAQHAVATPATAAATAAAAAPAGPAGPGSAGAGAAAAESAAAGRARTGSVRTGSAQGGSAPAGDAAARSASAGSAPAGAGAATHAWSALRAEVLTCTRCGLHAGRTQGVLGVGNVEADWMVIGEAPGAEEDRRGEPFVGRAGQLLDAMLRAIGLSRDANVYIANVLKSRPPNNRDPRPEEVAACLPYLRRQIELVRPRLLLAVGRIAAQNLLASEESLSRLRGRVHHFGELNTPLVVTYHPAYLLRNPADKRKAWEDLKFARSVFRQLTGGLPEDGHRS